MNKLLLTLVAVALVAAAGATPKVIVHGWDLLEASPRALAENADAFAKVGIDGVTVAIPMTTQDDGTKISSLSMSQDPKWRYETVAGYGTDLKKFVSASGLKENFLMCMFNFAPGRIAWANDAAWATFGNNLRILTRLAKESGMKGILIDGEDYCKSNQFFRVQGDPDYETAAKFARQRGREMFNGVFQEYPSITILSFWMMSACREDLETSDPPSSARTRGDLWHWFLNGMLDVMPMSATIVDGDECAYKYDSRSAFDDGAIKQLVRALPLVMPENRDKYRARLRVGFGQYIDMYTNAREGSGSWYFGEEGGSRLEHFRSNLADAAHSAEYIWIYGEKFSWVSWKRLPRLPWKFDDSWRWKFDDQVSWEQKLPGLSAVLKELRDPVMAAIELCDRMQSQSSENLFEKFLPKKWDHYDDKSTKNRFSVGGSPVEVLAEGVKNGSFHVPIDGAKQGDVFVVDLKVKGELGGLPELIWRTKGAFNWKLGRMRIQLGAKDENGELRGTRIVHVPRGVDGVMFRINARQPENGKAVVRGVRIFSVRQ